MTTRYNSIYDWIYYNVVTPRLGLALCLASGVFVVCSLSLLISNC